MRVATAWRCCSPRLLFNFAERWPPKHLFLAKGINDARWSWCSCAARPTGSALVPPHGDDHYYRARPRLGLKREEVIRLDDRFGLHPRLAPLADAWREGDLAIVHAAGIEDDTRSHFEAQDLMEHGGVVAGGWLGRYLRTRPVAQQSALACVAVGKALPECLLGAPSASVMTSFEDFALGGSSPAFRHSTRTSLCDGARPVGCGGA
jgi:hypothetical protein